jgi:hypothetical protein
MKISTKAKSKIYSAIHDNIMDSRISLKKYDSCVGISSNVVDTELFNLTEKIWGDIKKGLQIKD